MIGGLLLAGALGGLVLAVNRSSYVTRVEEARPQPVPFSHKHHVLGVGLDCRYCHTSVEETAFAGIPPTETCMTCHSQLYTDSPILEPVRESFRTGKSIAWTRVHDLPDFVYFNHSIHLHKGIGCQTCHGQVDRMPLMWKAETLNMEWCLSCHRDPARFVRPRDQVFNMEWEPPADRKSLGQQLVVEYRIQELTNCSICHR